MLKRLARKLNSRNGASLMAALLLFLICATVGSVILAAAATSMGRTSSADTDANRQRYSLESASRVIINDILGDTTAENYQGLKVDINQTWYVHLSSADYATTSEENSTSLATGDYVSTENVTSAVLYDTNSYVEDPGTQVTYGDFVLMTDQTQASASGKYPAYPQLSESSTTAKEVYAWDTESENDTTVSWAKTFNGTTNKASRSMVNTGDQSLQDVLCLMEDEIFRHYWYAINNTTQEKTQKVHENKYLESSPLRQDSDPLKDTPVTDWSEITGRMNDIYSVGTADKKPIEITPPKVDGADTKMYPVYAEVSLDQNSVLTIHLYCGSKEGTKDTTTSVKSDPEHADSSLYLVFEPEDGGPTLDYTATNVPSNPISRDPIYVQTQTGMKLAASNTDALKETYSGQDVILHITNDEGPGTQSENADTAGDSSDGLHQYTYDVYTKVTPTQTLTSQKRSWDYSVTWKNVSISTSAPAAD